MKLGEIVGTENRFLLACWLTALGLILIFGFVLGSDPVSILGVAESREFQVNFDSPVEIKHIYVLPSQIVRKGDLLIELGQSELEGQLRVLRVRHDKLTAEMQLRKELAGVVKGLDELVLPSDPLLIDLQDTKKEISLIENRLKNLFVFAEVDGAVGAVNFKDGEKAPAFAPLITLLPLNPTYVNGYINEQLSSSLAVGQIVEVTSSGGKSVMGAVVSVGSRIVPIPERLLRIQTLPAWGREVVVKIPGNNEFLLGEKVFVQKKWNLSLLSMAQAEATLQAQSLASVEPRDLDIPVGVSEKFKPEMSGLVFIPELKQFALISDDYPEDRPLLFLMNEEGEIQERQISIQGLSEMADIESISVSGGDLYLMSSLSATKKGKLKASRQLFVKVKRHGLNYHLVEKVDLRETLLQALRTSKDATLRLVGSVGVSRDGFEVEGHVVDGDDLYLSLKGPILARNEGLILKVSSFEDLFGGGSLQPEQVSLASRFMMKLPGRNVDLVVTDLVKEGEAFYVASSCRGQSCSAIWKVQEGQAKIDLIHEFKTQHLEGLALHHQTHQLFAVFDSKTRGQFAVLPPAAEKRAP